MKPQDYFITTPSIKYDIEIGYETFTFSEFDRDDMDFLDSIEMPMNIDRGKISFSTASLVHKARWIAKELDYLKDNTENYKLADYLRLKYPHVDDKTLEWDIVDTIYEVQKTEPYQTSYYNVIEYILDTWELTTSEYAQLKQEDADYYQEMQERSYQ